MKRLERILVPVDYSTTSGIALETAMSLAHRLGAAVEVLHVWSDGGYLDLTVGEDVLRALAIKVKEGMSNFIAQYEPPAGVELTSRLQRGVPWEAIAALSTEYDLIVMGTHGRTGIARVVLGSVAARVIERAACPVLTVREPDEAPKRRRSEEQIVHAMFEDHQQIERAFERLTMIGIAVEDISLVMSEDTHHRDFKLLDRTKALQGATAGGLMGGTIGGVLGGLIGVGSVITGGIGLVVMGPALAFAAAGGLFGGLLGRTVPEDRALVLKAEIAEGKTLMAVHLRDLAKTAQVQRIVEQCGGETFSV